MELRAGLQCHKLDEVVNGNYRVVPADGGFGSIVHYSCDPGYMLIGQSQRRCQGDRNWSGFAPTCETDRKILSAVLSVLKSSSSSSSSLYY